MLVYFTSYFACYFLSDALFGGIKMELEAFLKVLSESHAPSGREHWLHGAIREGFKGLGEVSSGNLENMYIKKKGQGKGRIMLMAHADEVFLMVTDICENGFLKFKPFGIDSKTLVSQEVIIHGKKDIEGIIGIKPPHLMNDSEKNSAASADTLLIDTGMSADNLKQFISIGDYVTLKRKFHKLQNNNVAGKAIDDRACIAAMLECAKELQNINHDIDVFFVCSCQEEVGHRGAKVGSYDVKPDIGIAIDVTFDNGPLGDTDRENKLGGGPVICVGPNVHPKVREKLMELADEYGIPYQVEVEPGNTGTDAWDIQISGEGIPSLLISIPIKYMHTTVELVNMDDIKNTGRLIAKLIEKLNGDELEGLLCF
jgi:endoglucanase